MLTSLPSGFPALPPLPQVELREARLLQREAMLERWLARHHRRSSLDGTEGLTPTPSAGLALGLGHPIDPFPALGTPPSATPKSPKPRHGTSRSGRKQRSRDGELLFSLGGAAPAVAARSPMEGGSPGRGPNHIPRRSPLVSGRGGSGPLVIPPVPPSTPPSSGASSLGEAGAHGVPVSQWSDAEVGTWLSILPGALPQ